MKQFGGLLFMFGAGSIVLGFVGYEFSLLMWIDNWGTAVGWAIRAAIIVAGGALWMLAKSKKVAQSETPPESHPAHSPMDGSGSETM